SVQEIPRTRTEPRRIPEETRTEINVTRQGVKCKSLREIMLIYRHFAKRFLLIKFNHHHQP
ncbi:MAG: hypothetical protein MJZ47_04400, partial [Bacteroidales bacterium]|nr:hypothetical protein [Bacteroidales bacterium]